MPPTTVTTRSLVLRPLTAADIDTAELVRWHTDPEGYRLMHEEPYADAAAFREVGRRWVDAWAGDGPSYWLAVERESGRPVGVGGVRCLIFEDRPYANLYYRIDPAARGLGYAREIAAAAVSFVLEWWPDLPVVARIAPGNEPSRRIALRAGMRCVGEFRGPDDPTGLPAPLLYSSPVVTADSVSAAGRAELVEVWERVNAAGGAVGFAGAAPRELVEAALDRHLAQVEAGESVLVRLLEPTHDSWADAAARGALLGFGFMRRLSGPAAHRVNLERVMVDPVRQGSGLGRTLMAALHATARTAGAELATIDYLGGTGLGEFYAGCGYVETGRVPGGLRFDFGDRDDVQMAYRLRS